MTPAPRVLLADGDALTRMGMRVTVCAGGFTVAAEAEDAATALACALQERPDLVVLAADLPGDGLRAVREMTAQLPATRVVVLSRHANGDELVEAVRAGASGYLDDDISMERLPAALHGVLDGEVALPRRLTRHLLDALSGRETRRFLIAAHAKATLTEREWDVIQLLADDASTAEMALQLGISEVTVRRHVSSLRSKLGLSSRAAVRELVRRSLSG